MQGVHVFGAASMGALRAAELDGFGMRGIGRIYAAYRDGYWPGYDEPFEDDDEVGDPRTIRSRRLPSPTRWSISETLFWRRKAGIIDRPGRDAP